MEEKYVLYILMEAFQLPEYYTVPITIIFAKLAPKRNYSHIEKQHSMN